VLRMLRTAPITNAALQMHAPLREIQ
jgi:hypothetical protein